MVPSIARQSVIIKCNQQASVLLGNYEFYYLAGLMKKLFDFPLSEEMQPEELFQTIKNNFDTVVKITEIQYTDLAKMSKKYGLA